MVKRDICIDSVRPIDDIRILITADDGTNTIMHMDRVIFEDLFGVKAKLGLYLELDIDDVTAEKSINIRGIQQKLGLRWVK